MTYSFIRTVFVSLLILIPTTAFSQAPKISWEVQNGFRYFRKHEDFQAMSRVFKQAKLDLDVEQTKQGVPEADRKPLTVLQLEKALEAEVISGRFNEISGADRRDGWAASIYLESCGRELSHTHTSCEMENKESYIEPKTTNIILQVDGMSPSQCDWTVDAVPIGTFACDQKQKLGAKKDARAVARVTYNEAHHVEVRSKSGELASIEIVVKDVLIVSFGDSFASGEGNPEKPVTWSNSFSEYSGSSWPRVFPVREPPNKITAEYFGDRAANWTNSQCHRSLYSHHTRAALHYALEHPHLSVTFLGYACTGAEIYEGILNAWWARDVGDEFWDDAPQLVKLLRDLCKEEGFGNTHWTGQDRTDSHFNSEKADFEKCKSFKNRKIDALLLTIGGNDVGFARMIANSAIYAPNVVDAAKGGLPWAYGLWRYASGPQTFDRGKELADGLSKKYDDLSKQLKSYLSQPSGEELLSDDRVILSAYPDVGTDEKGDVCKSATLGMDVHKIFRMNNPKASADGSDFVGYLDKKMREAAEKQGWKFADQHIVSAGANNFKGHGICAAGPSERQNASMTFPQPKRPSDEPFTWKPFYPDAWTPYSERNRWIVTPNDAYLTTDYLDTKQALYDAVQPLYAGTLSGSFHPNALGHAALADSVLVKLKAVLAGYEDSP